MAHQLLQIKDHTLGQILVWRFTLVIRATPVSRMLQFTNIGNTLTPCHRQILNASNKLGKVISLVMSRHVQPLDLLLLAETIPAAHI